MKVYESSHPRKRDYTKVPQIKIKIKSLNNTDLRLVLTSR